MAYTSVSRARVLKAVMDLELIHKNETKVKNMYLLESLNWLCNTVLYYIYRFFIKVTFHLIWKMARDVFFSVYVV